MLKPKIKTINAETNKTYLIPTKSISSPYIQIISQPPKRQFLRKLAAERTPARIDDGINLLR